MIWIKSLCGYTLALSLLIRSAVADKPVWEYECIDNYCEKRRIIPGFEDSAVSLAACQVLCTPYSGLWPIPTEELRVSNALAHIDVNTLDILIDGTKSPVKDLVRARAKLFKEEVISLATAAESAGGVPFTVIANITNTEITQITLKTDESYSLEVIETIEGEINAIISAYTYIGFTRGVETLYQLIIYDDIFEQFRIPNEVFITDKPVYPYRGILLDTSRNYISVATIKRTIDGISASKLNTFHWHITDSQSFPYVSISNPELSKLGAYSQKQTYSVDDVKDIMEHAKIRGVRVLPEFDAPAHVGEGWQDTDFVACFNKQPWGKYCQEPPCGQFDPTKPKLYDALEGIYKDMIRQFNPDIFHMGGDEVSMSCWNSTENIVEWMFREHGWDRSEEDFIKLWNEFQSQALDRFDKQREEKIPIILWTSTLTKKEYVETYVPKDRYIIQVWTTSNDRTIRELLDRDYSLILSNYDALYLDCGVAGWVNAGVNWCSPYKGWQKIYDNSPAEIGGERAHQFLGGEAALWTEQVDDTSVDSRIWPRAAALAERLWGEPESKWRSAEPRMLIHRQRLVNRGIGADALEPEWCRHYQENCPSGAAAFKDTVIKSMMYAFIFACLVFFK